MNLSNQIQVNRPPIEQAAAVEQTPDEFWQQGQVAPGKLGHFPDIRLNIQANAFPVQTILGCPGFKGAITLYRLRGVIQVKPVTLVAGQQQPGRHRHTGLVETAHHLGPFGR